MVTMKRKNKDRWINLFQGSFGHLSIVLVQTGKIVNLTCKLEFYV